MYDSFIRRNSNALIPKMTFIHISDIHIEVKYHINMCCILNYMEHNIIPSNIKCSWPNINSQYKAMTFKAEIPTTSDITTEGLVLHTCTCNVAWYCMLFKRLSLSSLETFKRC